MKKKQIKEYIKLILHKYPVDNEVAEVDDYEYLMSVFENHPEWHIKKGVGIRKILVRTTIYKNKCFYLVRNDNSETDISYIQCVDGKSSKISDIKVACRSAIRGVISKFKDENVVFGITKCAFTNEPLNQNNTHIDHYNLAFNELFDKWIENYNIDDLYLKLNNMQKDGEIEIYFIDDNIIQDFIIHHNNNTKLRAVSKKANLSLLKRHI